MKRKHDLLDLFNGVEDRFVVEAVESREAIRPAARKTRIVLIAALVALTALLAGCGIVYVLKMQNLKLGQQEVDREWYVQESQSMVSQTVPRQVLTLSGLKGSPNYQAAQEWYDFQQSYDPDHQKFYAVKDSRPEFPGKYDFYSPYTQEMVDKIEEICAKYGLKLMGAPVHGQTSECMMTYLGIENVLLPNASASAHLLGTEYYEGGFFRSEFDIQMESGEDAWPFQSFVGYLYSPKNCFNAQLYNLDGDDWQERNYTTKSGHEVLILRSPTVWESWAFCDVGDATVTIRLQTLKEAYTDEHGYPEVLSTAMTDSQLNQILDTINFDLKLTPGDPAILEGQKASTSLTQTQNGYTVEVKKAVTDGHKTAITLALTGPEDVDLEQYINDYNNINTGILNFSDQEFKPLPDQEFMSASGAVNCRLDGDGKANTVELFGIFDRMVKEGMPSPKGGKCNLFLKDLCVGAWNEEMMQLDTLWTVEGIWNFDLTLNEGDWREIEFIDEPITTKAIGGYDASGKAVWEDITITSLKMRTFGGEMTHTKPYFADTSDSRNGKFPTLVMKDGSSIRLGGDFTPYYAEQHDKPIPLDEIDYLLLIDGTKLYPQE